MSVVASPSLSSDALPIQEDGDGVLRVGDTRVTLDVLVEAFDEGATPEEIVQQYPTVQLADVYSVVAHLLRHRPEVDAYLARRRAQSGGVRTTNEARVDPRGVRDRLMARRRGV